QGGYDGSREDALLNAIIGRRPAGIAIVGVVHSPESRRRLLASHIPIVEMWDLTQTPVDMVVGFAHEEIGAAVFDFVHARGRKRPAIVSGRDGRAARRARSFQAAAKKQGIEVPIEWIPAPGALVAAREAAARLLAQPVRPDAIFCSSDLVALGVVTEADARGVKVPQELAVVGFGNLSFSEGVIPPLTTVHVDGPRIGRLAGTLLVDRAEGREPSGPSVDVRFTIVERGST